jgi:excisionase family DNA binding protein
VNLQDQDDLDKKLLDKREASALLKICTRKINYAMADGTLPYIKFGPRAVRFLAEDLDAYVKAHRIGGG